MEKQQIKVFVLMPFSAEFTDIFNLGILETAKELGMIANRLDTQIFVSDMLQKLYQEIDKTDFIIADMSTRNPNVFYEVGYADAKKKLIILLTNNADDIPFDFKHKPHIIYDSKNITMFKIELKKRLTWVVNELQTIQKEPLKTDITKISTQLIRTEYSDDGILKLRINIYNRIDKTSEKINSIYLYTTKIWKVFHNNQLCKSTEETDTNIIRHIIIPDFQVIPSNDFLPIDIEMRTNLYEAWNEDSYREDEYEKKGNIKIIINSESSKCSEDHFLKTLFLFVDIPF